MSAMNRNLKHLVAALVIGTVSSSARAQTATNDCGYNAGNEYPVGTSCSLLTFNKPNTFTSYLTATGCTGSNNNDAWGWFTATSNYVNLTFDPANNHRPILHLYTGACGSLSQVGCVNSGGNGNNANLSIEVVEGQDYMVRIQRHNDSGTMNGSFCAWRPAFPANDNPCSATSLTVGATCSNTAGTNRGATSTTAVAAPSCGDYQGGDVWYSFVAPANGAATIRTAANGLTDSGIALYSATSCSGTFTEVACAPNGNGNMGQISYAGLTPGQTYYVRVWGDGNESGSFNICVVSLANDEACGATSLTVGATCSNTSTTNLHATPSGSVPAPPCGNYTGGDVWYSFVAPASGAATIRTGTNGLTNSAIALYSASSCSAGFSLITCAVDGNGNMGQITEYGLTPGATYYVRVWGENGASGTFNICAFVPAVNDEPCVATDITIGTSCSYTGHTNVNATISSNIPAPGCGNANFNDVWFRFTAPSNGLVTFRVTVGTLANPQFAVYRASSCNGPFTLVKCDNASGPGNAPFMTLTPLEITPGDTYYLRVWGNNGTTGTFNLCAFTAPATGDCIYVLRMWDSQGDGWGNSRVSIQVGASPAVNYWNSNAIEDVVYIPVSTGQNVTLSYATGGSGNQGEIRYALQLINGPLYMDGPTPGTGLRWAGTANCQSAAPLPSDCMGGTAICHAQQINDNPTNTGLSADLNLHTRGCLSNNERQGLWYRFTVSSSGTLGFTITPQNLANDYDFALWGPYPSFSCPVEQLPVRCNYSGTTGATGVSSAGTNPSEPAGGSKWSSLMNVTAGENYMLYISNWSQSGLAFDLSWQLTNGASLDCQLLPVQLLSLNGAPVPSGIQLDWQTATESNSAFFAVERMDETGAFQQIGQVAAAGNSASTTAYTFLDPQPLPGFNYYRLKMIDADGSSELSEVISVANRYGSFVGSLFPNPAEDQINLAIDAAEDMDVHLRVLDASGRLVREHRARTVAAQHTVTMPLHGIESGQYLLMATLSNGESHTAGRFVVR